MTTAPAESFVDRDEILPLLGRVKRSGEWLMALCPAHSDGAKHGGKGGESLGLSDSGVLRCFAGCDFKTVIQALRGASRPSSVVTPIRRAEERMTRLYQYRDMDGNVVAEKGRFERTDGTKTFRWRKPGVEGWPGGSSGITMSEMPLYGLPKLLERPDDTVYFVEGEKACEACWEQGLVAVTHGGGAGTRDFGDALNVLAGRRVNLWPDNDAPGAEYMALLRAKLTLLGAQVRIVSVPLPPKGDAWDFFAAGHTVKEITAASPTDPVVSIVGSNSVRIVQPTEAGAVTFLFDQMEKQGRSFDTELTVSCFTDPEPYTQSINLNSHSGIGDLRRDLNEVFGKEYGWTRVLNRAFGLARDAYLSIERGVSLGDVPDSLGEVFLVPPLVVADGTTIFFGDGSSLKSYISAELAYCMAYGEQFCGMPTPNITPMVIDYEDSGSNYKRRVKRLALAREVDDVSRVHYWPGNGLPIADQLDAISRYVQKHGIGMLIIDSAAGACGGDVLDVKAVLKLFGALKKLALPVIMIAHVTKNSDNMKPYGVVYWHNEARRTWFVARVQEDESDEVDVGFYNRKVNDGPRPAPIAFHVSFDKDLHGPVNVSISSMERAPAELLQHTSTKNQVWVALDKGAAKTAAEIAEETGLSRDTVDRALKAGQFIQVGVDKGRTKGGRPAAIWSRQEVNRTFAANPADNAVNTPKGFTAGSFPLRGAVNPKTPQEGGIESEELTAHDVPPCWKCGLPAVTYDGELRPICDTHR